MISFHKFLRLLSVFNPRTGTEEKLEFLFKIYDWDGDGKISRQDLAKVRNILRTSRIKLQFFSEDVKDTIDLVTVLM
jgi:serine/threonine-protein phosphatase 2B regulatory subunit